VYLDAGPVYHSSPRRQIIHSHQDEGCGNRGLSNGCVLGEFLSRCGPHAKSIIDTNMNIHVKILYMVSFSIETANVNAGGARHIYYLEEDPNNIIRIAKLTLICQPIAVMSSAFGKCSVAFLIRRFIVSIHQQIDLRALSSLRSRCAEC
jgi:hypothetical protein